MDPSQASEHAATSVADKPRSTVVPRGAPWGFELALPSIQLEAGARLAHHVVRGFAMGPKDDLEVLAPVSLPPAWLETGRPVRRTRGDAEAVQRRTELLPAAPLSKRIPTIVVVHALTGDARAGGPGGFWAPVLGPGETIDTRTYRVLCFNLLGSCYGTTGPADEAFPTRLEDARFPPPQVFSRGNFGMPEQHLPATVTTWDQARSILLALDRLGVDDVHLLTGGSLGGMVALCMAALDPGRFRRLAPIAATEASSAWVIAWNHVGRQAILADPGFPHDVGRGLELARELAMITYRAEPSLQAVQGRRMASEQGEVPPWSSRDPYRMQTYLEYQGHKLLRRFDARSYLALIGAIDHHDLARAPAKPEPCERWPWDVPPMPGTPPGMGFGLPRIRAATLGVCIDSDLLFFPQQTASFIERLRRVGVHADLATIETPHGHDAFLIEWPALNALLAQALSLPPGGSSMRPGATSDAGAAEVDDDAHR